MFFFGFNSYIFLVSTFKITGSQFYKEGRRMESYSFETGGDDEVTRESQL